MNKETPTRLTMNDVLILTECRPRKSKNIDLEERESRQTSRKDFTPWDGKSEPTFETVAPWDGKTEQ